MDTEYQWGQGQGVVVASVSPAERAAFITRTYLHLFGAIGLFAVLEWGWFQTNMPSWLLQTVFSGRFGMLVFLAAFTGVSMLANSWAMAPGNATKQYLGLGLYTLAESVLFVPLIAFAIMQSGGPDGDPTILPRAITITLTLFGCLTGVVFLTRKDFSFLRSALYFAGIASVVLVFASLIFSFTLGAVFSYAMIALACGYILYGTSNVMLHYHPSQHVAAALSLFASVMLLFWYVLRIFLDRRR